MIVGITGTTRGLTAAQRETLRQVLADLAISARPELHHGDCVGVDEQAATIAWRLGYWIVGHPADDPDGRAHSTCNLLLAPRDSAARNRDIVDVADLLIGCPGGEEEWPGSGTWYTINYARTSGVPLLVVSPSGRILEDTRQPATPAPQEGTR
ncbi:hypothetical protein K1T35_47450 (plasmid) [Pseudonocardia sp. DSM 110487]|uniref:hypothetical protein n=1 Tax=Pseudonocardia sp. DSM 110487 TaxID=2865833 RepID=UPI001C69939A|nr:hypothetical protein [Pseudonocardia sp. DSM 110487]QYN40986.1 hypothetical protein K1T35_47450 [Pseudonocardia sp. DSM 110487]